MFDNYNPYTLRTEIVEGITRYFASFKDGEGIHRETEVSRPVYIEFQRFVCVERNLRRWDERHTIYADLPDEAFYNRTIQPAKNSEEMAFDCVFNEQLRQAIQRLPEIQRRRFVLHHEFGLTFEQIAEMEGCTKRAVKFSFDLAIKKIQEEIIFS